jgi:hypothetical protein
MTFPYVNEELKTKCIADFYNKPFLLKSRCCRFIRDAIAGGRLWMSLSLMDNTLKP